MPSRSNIPPHTVAEVLDDRARFDPAALAAVRELARAKPWQGTQDERLEKFRTCARKLAEAYGLEAINVTGGSVDGLAQDRRTIVLSPKLSVVTFLHLIAAARSLGQRECFRFSLNLFKRCFPRSFANLTPVGPYLVRREDVPPGLLEAGE